MQLYAKILIGMVAGVVVGGIANFGDVGWLHATLDAVKPFGEAFIRAITMVVIPLVVASLLVGTASLGDIRRLGRIGLRTFLYYMLSTVLAIMLGLLLSNLVKPGSRIDSATRDSLSSQFAGEAASKLDLTSKQPSLTDTLLNIIPRNPIASAANFDLLPVILFTVLFGAALSVLPKQQSAPVIAFFDGVNEASMVIIGWVMHLAPYAVFVLIAAVISRFGMDLLRSLLIYAAVVAGGLFLHTYGTLGLIVRFLAGVDPRTFYKRIFPVQLVAFSTSSSNATLPVTLKTAETKLGASNSIASFVLPLGATINMDGTGLYQAVAVMFIGQIYGLDFGVTDQLKILLTATLASVGTAGVPSAGIITIIIVLQSLGMGDQLATGISLILGVDRILDMMRTATNVTGDLACCTYVAQSESEMHLPTGEDLAREPS
ncbi:MAG: dicarboxylate/amino acid:cation symporter [Bryobacterales bacterium]|nr:dicarboxylate/amino acid:cation symporter [Bryobacterales bacterium]